MNVVQLDYKDRVEGLVLFNALLLHLSDDKYHVHDAAPWP